MKKSKIKLKIKSQLIISNSKDKLDNPLHVSKHQSIHTVFKMEIPISILKPTSPRYSKKTLTQTKPKATLRNKFATILVDDDEDEYPERKTLVTFDDNVNVIHIQSVKAIQAKFAADKKAEKKKRRQERKLSPKLSPMDTAKEDPHLASLKSINEKMKSQHFEDTSIDRFVHCSGASKECAIFYLQRAYGDVNNAVEIYFRDPHLHTNSIKNKITTIKTSKVSDRKQQKQQKQHKDKQKSSKKHANSEKVSHQDPKSPILKAKSSTTTSNNTTTCSRNMKRTPPPSLNLSKPKSPTSPATMNNSSSLDDPTLKIQTWAAGIFCVIVAIWLLQVLVPSSNNLESSSSSTTFNDHTNNNNNKNKNNNNNLNTFHDSSNNHLGEYEKLERMKRLWSNEDLNEDVNEGNGNGNRNIKESSTASKTKSERQQRLDAIKRKRKKNMNKEPNLHASISSGRRKQDINTADISPSAYGNLMNEIVTASIVMTSPKQQEDSARGVATPAIAKDNHIKFEVHGLERSDFTGNNAHHKLSIGWLILDNERIRIDEDSLFDFRRQVTWRSFKTGQSLIGTDRVRAVDGILVEGASADSSAIGAVPMGPSATNEYTLDDGTGKFY